jgi:hypothetical protein
MLSHLEHRPVIGKLIRSLFGTKPETAISAPGARNQAALARRQWISNPWHAVAIVPGTRACPAARAAGHARYLSAEAPRLPLPDCGAHSCTCHYRHFQDRRRTLRRAADVAASRVNWAGRERRAAPGRRCTD